MTTDAHGRAYRSCDVDRAVASVPGTVARIPDDLLGEVVDRLVAGQIGGWFQGGSELGPRALGHRSIVCAPTGADTKARLNGRVKYREMFRPFAPAVLRERVEEWFALDGTPGDSPFMLRVVPFRPEKAVLVPAVVHEDGTGRLQTLTPEANGRFYELVRRFGERTGIPMVLNTSLNVRGEPIAERPEDALWCLRGTGLDFCVVHDHLVTRRDGCGSLLDHVPHVVAEEARVPVTLGEGSLRLRTGGEACATVRTRTPWGATRVAVPPRLLVLLSVVDGCRDGHALLGALDGRPTPQELTADLLVLRRMGVVEIVPRGQRARRD